MSSMIDFEDVHQKLCEELSEILHTAPTSESFDRKIREIEKNFQTWIDLGRPSGLIKVS